MSINKEEILERIEEIKSKTMSGIAHNHNVDELMAFTIVSLINLTEMIEKLEEQNGKLAQANIRLQKWIVALTITTVILGIINAVDIFKP